MLDQNRASSFDSVAALYDAARPSYPDQAIDAVIAYAAVSASSALLEIGPGTGKATVLFAARGLNVHCVEPGRALSEILLQRTKSLRGTVSVENKRFEELSRAPASYDLIYAAQSFHWLDPATRLEKIHSLLRNRASFAAIWNKPTDEGSAHRRAFDNIYDQIAPELKDEAKSRPFHAEASKLEGDLKASGLFSEVCHAAFRWSQTYTAKQYTELLNTYSDHRALDPQKFKQLSAGLQNAIEEQGGSINMPYTTVVQLAKKLDL